MRVALKSPAVWWTGTPDTVTAGWAAPALPRIHELARLAGRRAAVAQELWMGIGWEASDAAEAGADLPARRAAELAGRAAVLADACEHAAAEAEALATPPPLRAVPKKPRSYRSTFAPRSVAPDPEAGVVASPPRRRPGPPDIDQHLRRAPKPRSYIS
ncbi:hypothetical protein [Streptomyces erythrochromogenes]|uniref:hypothetical protein n=1 Tax=Streptomyces erythrochromogenes TaxID=285574 RepID=UPI0004CD6F58|nr:hypothetical protein [Streptomyces erythrochromogenes]